MVLNGAYINSDRNKSTVIKFNARTVLPNSWTKLVKQANIPQVADSCNRYFLLPFLVPCPSECSCQWRQAISQERNCCSVFRKTAHVAILVPVLVNICTVLARPTCTAGGLGHIDHVHISSTTKQRRWS